jgi:hypothetical protein
MAYEMIDLKRLKLLEKNPRTITKTQMEKLKAKLRNKPEFLQKRSVLVNVVDDVYQVYAGNQRVRAARKLGWKQIPCTVSFNMTQEEMDEEIILDNSHFGDYDYDMLANHFDIDLLISCGLTEAQLGMDVSSAIQDVTEEPTEKEEKIKYCPHCNGQL